MIHELLCMLPGSTLRSAPFGDVPVFTRLAIYFRIPQHLRGSSEIPPSERDRRCGFLLATDAA